MQRINKFRGLPPNLIADITYGKLTFKITSIIFTHLVAPVIGRIQLWGETQKSYIEVGLDLTYPIYCNAPKFSQYIRDAMVANIQLIDSRNNQHIATSTVNFLLYLKKIEHIAPGSGPFLDETLELCLPILSTKKKNIGELNLIIICQMFPNNELVNTQLNYSIHQSINSKQKNDNNHYPQILKNSSHFSRQNSIISKSCQNERQKQYQTDKHMDFLEIPMNYNRISTNTNKSHNMNNSKPEGEVKKNNFDLQIMNLKADAQLLIELSKAQPKTINRENIEIYSFIVSKLSNKSNTKPIQFIDISIEEGQSKNRFRIYPINLQQGLFKSSLSVSKKANISLFVGEGKGQIKVSEIISQRSTMVPILTKKFFTIGTVNIKYQSQQTKYQHFSRTQAIHSSPKNIIEEQKNNEKIIQEKQLMHPEVQYNSDKLLLIGILQIKHPFEKYPIITIKQNKWKYPYSNNKFIFSQYGQLIGITMKDKNNQITLGLATISTFNHVPIIPQSLRCCVVFDDYIKIGEGKIHIVLEVGNLKQINYSLNHYNQKQILQNKDNQQNQISKPYYRPEQLNHQKQKLVTQSNEKQQKKKIKIYKQKLHTQIDQRVQSQPISESKLNQSSHQSILKEQQQNQDIYLLQMLSKALHSSNLAELQQRTTISEPKTRKQFVSLWSSLMKQDDGIFAEALSDMFIEQEKVMFNQFKQCIKSYHNFVELYWSIKSESLNKLVKKIPDLQQKIQKDSELGIIQQSNLWKKTLTNVPNDIQSSINRIYHISPFSPLITPQIIEDIRAVIQNNKSIPQPTPTFISDLGKIVKQTLEQVLNNSITFFQGNINIKSMVEVLFKCGISVSYWESLILIQQIKAWYGLDMDMGEGIISSNTVKQWMNVVIKRKESQLINVEKKQKQIEIHQKQQKVINEKPLVGISINNSQKLRSQNDQQILNIANLLRQNDNYNFNTFLQQDQSVINPSYLTVNKEKIQEQKHKSTIKPQIQWKYLHIYIKQVRIKPVNEEFLKLSLEIQQQIKIFYFKGDGFQDKYYYEKVNLKSIQKGNSTLSIVITDRHSSIFISRGILHIQDLGSILNKVKTIVLYDTKNQIIGKAIIRIQIKDQQKMPKSQQKTSFNLQILKVNPKQLNLNLYHRNILLIQNINTNKYKIQIKGELYNEEIMFSDQQSLKQAIVPLQQLFFREFIQGDYPIIDTNQAKLIGSISLKITKQKLAQNVQNQSQIKDQIKLKQIQQISKQKVINKKTNKQNLCIFFDEIISFGKSKDINKVFSFYLYVKNSEDQRIVYKGPLIKHMHCLDYFSSTTLNQFYYLNQHSEKLSVEIASEGKIFGQTQIQFIQNSTLIPILGDYFKRQNLTIRLKVRVMKIPQTTYNIERVLKSLSQPNFRIYEIQIDQQSQNKENKSVNKNIKLKSIKELNKLTYTQLKLFQDIVNSNQINFSQKNIQRVDQFIEELLFHDPYITGFLQKQKLQDILDLCKIPFKIQQTKITSYDYIKIIYLMHNNIKLQARKNAYQQIDRLHQQILKKYK